MAVNSPVRVLAETAGSVWLAVSAAVLSPAMIGSDESGSATCQSPVDFTDDATASVDGLKRAVVSMASTVIFAA